MSKIRSKSTSVESTLNAEDIDAKTLLTHVRDHTSTMDLRGVRIPDENYNFCKLLEAINLKASSISRLQPKFPKMDLTALYCLGIAVQEYARYLSTDIVSQKRAIEGKQHLNTLFTKDEIQQHSLPALIERVQRRSRKYHATPPKNGYITDVKVLNQKSEYDELLQQPEWKGVLKKQKKDKHEDKDTEEASKRRSEALRKRLANLEAAKKKKMEQREAEEVRFGQKRAVEDDPHMPLKKIKTEENYDIFDATFSQSKSSKGERTQPSHKKKKMKSFRGGF